MPRAEGRHVHVDQDATRPHEPDNPHISVVDGGILALDGTDCSHMIEAVGRKIRLTGEWTLRQYRNPVPCGASVVLLPGPGAEYEWLG